MYYRPARLDDPRARQPAVTRNRLPHQRSGAEDQECIAVNQEIHGRPVRHFSALSLPI